MEASDGCIPQWNMSQGTLQCKGDTSMHRTLLLYNQTYMSPVRGHQSYLDIHHKRSTVPVQGHEIILQASHIDWPDAVSALKIEWREWNCRRGIECHIRPEAGIGAACHRHVSGSTAMPVMYCLSWCSGARTGHSKCFHIGTNPIENVCNP